MTRQFSFASRRGGLPTGRGGLAALLFPAAVTLFALASMRGPVTGLNDPATPLVAGLLFLIAAPTTWLFAIFSLAPQVTAVLGVITSFPLWFVLGIRIADISWTWGEWWRRYATSVFLWIVFAMLGLVTVASIVG